MRHVKNGWVGWLAVQLLFVSCVNHIADDVLVGTVPITFTVKLQKSGTKITGNAFDGGDETGFLQQSVQEILLGNVI